MSTTVVAVALRMLSSFMSILAVLHNEWLISYVMVSPYVIVILVRLILSSHYHIRSFL